MTDHDPIDRYLHRLLAELRGRTGEPRRVVEEAEGHLRDAQAELVAGGVEPGEAAERAVRAFGDARLIARQFTDVRSATVVVKDLVGAAIVLSAVGLCAIALSGLLALGAGRAWGTTFVAGDAADVTYTTTRCADFAEYAPGATSCEAAAAAHHADEVVVYRTAMVVPGLALAVLAWRRRRRLGPDGFAALPEGFVPIVGATVFGLAGAGLGVLGLGALSTGASHGAGQWLSGAVVSLAVAAAFGWQVLDVLRLRVSWGALRPSGPAGLGR